LEVSELGNRVKEVRLRRGLTQADLAAEAGVSRKTIVTVENRIFIPSALLALRIARALKTSVDHLFFIVEETER
jgi:putative transcriptional regulator